MAAPILLRVTRYRCPYCPRSGSKRAAVAEHIARCWHNPEARGCKTCVLYEPPSEGPYGEHPGWPEECGEGISIASGLHTGCPSWQPVPGGEA